MLILLSTIGIEISGIITALSAAVLAIGMALQTIISNVANGIVIVATHMFKKGDFITVGSDSGSIVDINFLFTTIMTTDNKKITIPNSSIVNSSVINAGANPKRRVDFTFSVAYETDVETVKRIVTEVMTSNGKIDLDPKPFCRLKVLNSSSIDFFANCWCDSEDYWDVYYYVIENVFNNRSNFVVYKKFDNLLSFLSFMKFVNCKIDFLIVNIFMPGSNPFDLLKEISKYKSHINKIICTGGFASNEILSCLNKYDVSYFINKPFTEKSLHSCFNEYFSYFKTNSMINKENIDDSNIEVTIDSTSSVTIETTVPTRLCS